MTVSPETIIPPPYVSSSTEHEPPPPYRPDWIRLHSVRNDDVTVEVSETDPGPAGEGACAVDPWIIPDESRDPRVPVGAEQQALLNVAPFQAPPSYSSLDVSLPLATVAQIETCPPAYLTAASRQCSHISLAEHSEEMYGQLSLVNGEGQPVRFGEIKVGLFNNKYETQL